MTLTEILENAFSAIELDERDAPARELALIYARTVDRAVEGSDPVSIYKFGPKLVDLLKELHMTPASRAVVKAMEAGEEVEQDPAEAIFAELRSD